MMDTPLRKVRMALAKLRSFIAALVLVLLTASAGHAIEVNINVDYAAWIDSLHQEFWSMVQAPPTIQKTYWDILDGKDQDAILEQLNKDLVAGYLTFSKATEDAATAKKLEEWRQKITGLSQQPVVQMGRGFAPRVGRRRLGAIIDENTAETNLAGKYGDKYATMLAAAVRDNPRLVAESAGQIAGGEYSRAAKAIVPDLIAAGMGSIVSDVLEELKFGDTKFVWDSMVSRPGALKTIGQSLAKGDYDGAWNAFFEQYKKDAESYSRTFVAAAIDSILSPSGLTADPFSTGLGFRPGTAGNPIIDGATNTVSVGQLYLALIDAEIAFIDWGKKYLREQSSIGDGACIRLYESEYERHQNVGAAYTEFADCMPTARYSAFFAFTNGLKDLGMGEREASILFLEDHRRGVGYASDPLTWLARKVENKKKALQSAMVANLKTADERVNRQHKLVLRHVAEWLLETAAFHAREEQLIELEKELDRLVAGLEALLESMESDIDRVAKYYGAVPGVCPVYESARDGAVQALLLGEAAQAKAHGLQSRINAFDAGQCGDLSPSSATGDTFEAWLDQAKARRSALGSLAAQVLDDVTQICAASGEIRTAADKQAARGVLDDALELARGGTEQSAFELQDEAGALDRVVAEAEAADPGKWANAEDIQGQLAELRAGMRDVRTTYDKATQDLDSAKAEMARQVQRVRNLMDALDTDTEVRPETNPRTGEVTEKTVVIETLFNQIEEKLKPLERAPVAGNVRILMANLRALRENAIGCDEQLKVSWLETGDLESRDSNGRMHPWSTRTLFFNPPINVLDGDIIDLEQRCAALGESGGGPLEYLEAIHEEQRLGGIEQASIEDALSRVDLCVSEALIAYDDRWLQPQLVTVPDVTGITVAEARGRLGSILTLSIGDAAGNEGGLEAAEIASQVPAAGEQADEADEIVVALLPPAPPEEEQPDAAAGALAQGQAQLGRCDFDGFRQTYDSLADDAPEKAALRTAYANEQQAREIGKEGRQLFADGQFGQAAGSLERAAELAQCDETRDRLQAAASTARGQADEAAQAEAERQAGADAVAAAESCDFNSAVAAAQKLEVGHPDRARVKVLLDAEQQARAQLEAGRAAAASGDREGALAAFEAARSATACPQTVAVIDQAVAGLPGPAVASPAPQQPQPQPPAGGETPAPQPAVNVAAMGAEIEGLIAACRLDDAEWLLGEIHGTPEWDTYWRMIDDERRLVDRYNEALREAQSGGDPFLVQVIAEEPAYQARCHELASRAQTLIAEAENVIIQQEQWAVEQREAERQQAMSSLATGLMGVLNQLNGRSPNGSPLPGSAPAPAPASGGGFPSPGMGGGGGGQNPQCASFTQESQAHGQRVAQLSRQYQSMAGADRGALQAKACEMFREMQKGEEIVRRAQAAGCAPPNVPTGYSQQALGSC